MKFSERIGKVQPKLETQLDSMDMDLRNSLWNVFTMFFIKPMVESNSILKYTNFNLLVEKIWFSFFKEPLDQMPIYSDRVANSIRDRFFKWTYLEVYDFIDYVASNATNESFKVERFIDFNNAILKRELSGYRFVGGVLAPITNDEEIASIDEAILVTANPVLKGVNIHLSSAIAKLSDRKSPDYRNSIKESISAVESICMIISDDPNAELGKALKAIKTKVEIHGALEQGFKNLYGYTSDGDGIRHALLDETSLDQEDALYMLISCSAFINYLIAKATKAGLI